MFLFFSCFQANPQPEHLANGIVIGESYRIYAMQKVNQLDSKSSLHVLDDLLVLHNLIYAMQKANKLNNIFQPLGILGIPKNKHFQ